MSQASIKMYEEIKMRLHHQLAHYQMLNWEKNWESSQDALVKLQNKTVSRLSSESANHLPNCIFLIQLFYFRVDQYIHLCSPY